ncbi:MAG: hypothetical protein JWQ11_559 [Rhizobacter sp.]|nr:hypothetical protein [Rhizobacter sp.]
MQWDLFCRIVDNFGDIGVCWRLAADLGSRGEQVRLFVDDASALSWLAPQGAANVTVVAWESASDAEPAQVVIEAFGCDPHEAFVARMATRKTPPVWINLEYLSAEPYVERSHGLSSPVMAGPGRGLVKRFFYPGFTLRTGGLIREPWLAAEQAAFDRLAWLAAQGIAVDAGERVVSLFCYDDAPVERLIEALSGAAADASHGGEHNAGDSLTDATLLLAASGAAATLARAALGESMQFGRLRCIALPFLSQRDYDRLLWACDLNFVRGEDSFVRAQWAGRPFVWQAYRQDDDLHLTKVDAFLDLHLSNAPREVADFIRRSWHRWNAGHSATSVPLDASARGTHALADLDAANGWDAVAANWKASLAQSPDLTHALMQFVSRLVRISR